MKGPRSAGFSLGLGTPKPPVWTANEALAKLTVKGPWDFGKATRARDGLTTLRPQEYAPRA